MVAILSSILLSWTDLDDSKSGVRVSWMYSALGESVRENGGRFFGAERRMRFYFGFHRAETGCDPALCL